MHGIEYSARPARLITFMRYTDDNQNSLARPVWITIGLVSIGLATAGALLPLLPTTPFLLVAAYAFAQSSPRLHRWLLHHKQFGPLIHNWQEYGAIDRKTKIVAVIVMLLTPVITWLIGAPVWALGAQAVVLCCAGIFVVTRPDVT